MYHWNRIKVAVCYLIHVLSRRSQVRGLRAQYPLESQGRANKSIRSFGETAILNDALADISGDPGEQRKATKPSDV